MGVLDVIDKGVKAVEQATRDQLDARERRGRSPRFRAEMARENREASRIFDGLAHNAYELGVMALLKTPANLCLNAMRTVWDRKYSGSKYFEDAFKMFFGKDGIAHDTLKVVANAIHLAGQGARIGVRQLFKV
jgi:hypothetical protein